MKVAVLCGGPSLERGISLNSARSVCDHLQSDQIDVIPIYFDQKRNPYLISRAQLYSNTPSDFDFKLKQTAKPLSQTGLKKQLKSVDIAFPVMHGSFGEDGQIQRRLNRMGVPFVGSPEKACKKAFDKYRANQEVKKAGFHTLSSTVLKIHRDDHVKVIKSFFKKHQIKRAIVKPATGGSSISVFSVTTEKEALEKAGIIFSKRIDTRVVIEPFCEGVEFTVIILQNKFGMPVAILPSEIEMSYDANQIFDYRKKYLATNQIKYHCPPRFDNKTVEKIQIQAEQLFTHLGMQDFARFDGWLLKDGSLWFSDFNPISGMEQNSFLFMQSSKIGMSHSDTLHYVLQSACRRQGIEFPKKQVGQSIQRKKKVNVLFGGQTAERQVSVMSGTNVWLKLRNSEKYDPSPYLLDLNQNVWKLPYALTLNHTVEEIMETCQSAKKDEERLHRLIERVKEKLAAKEIDFSEPWFAPEKMSLETFIKSSEFVFIGLHGGIGEDGRLQTKLQKDKIAFNGSGAKTSKTCMDKYETGQLVSSLKSEGIFTAEKKLEKIDHFKSFKIIGFRAYWKELTQALGSKTVIVKPVGDGCSAGIARLFSAEDLRKYVAYAEKGKTFIPEGVLKNQHGLIEMPPVKMKELLFEQFIITDQVSVVSDELKWRERTNWIEITMGLLEEKPGKLKAMSPSLTVATGEVLSLEEKFQGGTGVNITPPPQPFVKPSAIKKAMKRMELVAQRLGIQGYARIDAFMHRKTGELIIIEANSTPGLTPSTVIYHQALEEKPALYPTQFLEKVIEAGMKRDK